MYDIFDIGGGVFRGPTLGLSRKHKCQGPLHIWGGLTPPDPPPLISHTDHSLYSDNNHPVDSQPYTLN